VSNKTAQCVVIWLTINLTLKCVEADQELSPLMGEHCLGCSTLLIFHHGKRSHALVTQCVHVRACKNPRHGREETRWRLFVPTDMSPCYRSSPIHTKSKDKERTCKVICTLSTCDLVWQNLHACTNMPRRRAQAQETLTHAAGWMLQQM